MAVAAHSPPGVVGTGGTWKRLIEFPGPVVLELVLLFNSPGRERVTRAPTTGSFDPARSTTPSTLPRRAGCCAWMAGSWIRKTARVRTSDVMEFRRF